jgi:hypothetical protein
LNITNKEVEELLCALILDRKVAGKIDQISQILELDQEYFYFNRSEDLGRTESLWDWSENTMRLASNVMQRS